MLKRGNNRGLSTIVATLLIILLTLVAVGIIWVVVKNVIQGGAEQVSLGKFTLNLEIKGVSIDPATPNNVNVRIKRDAGEGQIYGLKFIVDDGDTTEVVSLDNYSMNELEERTINLTLKSITNSSNIIKVSVAPIFKLESGKEVTGDVKDVYDVSKSSGSVTGGITCSGSTSQSCSITNGVGSQSRTCTNPPNWDSWGTCTVVSCNSGYMQSGNTCVASTCSGSNFQSCTITNGVGNQTRTCNAGVWSSWGTCTVVSCNSGYMQSGNTCVVATCSGSNFQSCTITNGVGNQTRTCNAGVWSSWGTCTVVSCNSGYVQSGNTCVVATSAPAWQTGMISWWRFNGNANDYYGINNGTVNGATLTNTGCKSGQCYSFDGSSDYINAGNSNSLNSIGCFNTISLWMQPTGALYNYEMYISKYYGSTNDLGFDFGLYSDGRAIIMYRNGTTLDDRLTINTVFSLNTLINFVVVQSGSNAVYVYKNGALLETITGEPCMVNPSSSPLTIGDRGTGLFFNGSIDEVMIFNRSLNSTEVQQIYSYSYP